MPNDLIHKLIKIYRNGEYTQINMGKAAELLKIVADRGVINSQIDYYDILLEINTKKSLKTSSEYLLSLNLEGNTAWMVRMSRMYRDGNGVKQDLEKAATWMRDATNFNSGFTNELVDILIRIGDDDSIAEAVSRLEARSESGDYRSMIRLGRMYRDGNGVDPDLGKAATWMRGAADANPDFTNELADVLVRIGDDDSIAEAVSRLEARSESGDYRSMIRLGRMYRDGNGVDPDLGKAATWMRGAADANPDFTNELADVLVRIGDDDSIAEAVSRLEARSESGDRGSKTRLKIIP